MRPLVAGNWKMNGLAGDLGELAVLRDALAEQAPSCDVLICPPATLIARAAWTVKGAFALGGQDCHAQGQGAFTGDISAEMLKDAGASYVIVGHSERRHTHGESDSDVAAKARAAWRAGLKAIICIGETEAQRDAGDAHAICQGQLDTSVPDGATPANTVLAYEPVWAIGTGRTPTGAEIAAMHAHIRACLLRRLGPSAKEGAKEMLILYGGSVKPDNAREILNLPEVGGALVGGASLKAADFLSVVRVIAKRF
ncbi:MAG TPA: triose-phosphate isomerase [Rhizomicrobium sp.]|jgi:triosephosphate isomerase|nr:triose-phosphate isomerase [Rhizomicrobium sp.]